MTRHRADAVSRCYADVSPIRQNAPTVIVIDDNAVVREAIESLLRSVGYHSIGFNSTREFHSSSIADRPKCLIVDVGLPGTSGLEFQSHLARAGVTIPFIFMSGNGDIPTVSQAMKAGAIEFLTKPFREQDLLDALAAAIERDRAGVEEEETNCRFRMLFDS